MAETWEPGTVGVATVDGEEVSGAWVDSELGTTWFSPFTSAALVEPCRVTNFRPFVVIDTEDAERIEQLLTELRLASFSAHGCGAESCLREILRAMLPSRSRSSPRSRKDWVPWSRTPWAGDGSALLTGVGTARVRRGPTTASPPLKS